MTIHCVERLEVSGPKCTGRPAISRAAGAVPAPCAMALHAAGVLRKPCGRPGSSTAGGCLVLFSIAM